MTILNATIREKINKLNAALRADRAVFKPVIPQEYLSSPPHIFDLTKNNPEVASLDVADTPAFADYINAVLQKSGCVWGLGGYGENRGVYQSPLFQAQGEARSVHLALDIWLPVQTAIFTPLPAKVHSFAVNDNHLDYGPTIILEHELGGVKFYTLYGHLAESSLNNLAVGSEFAAGDEICRVGEMGENGHWPPHVHFQIIADMLGKQGDFPGVARPSEKAEYLTLCPNPNILLGIQGLG